MATSTNVPGQPYSPPPVPAQNPSNALATAGFVVALVGAIIAFIPFVGLVSWAISPIGLILAAVGLLLSFRRQGAGRGLAIAGVVLGVVGLIICGVWTSAISHAASSVATPAAAAPAAGSAGVPAAGSSAAAASTYTYKVTGAGQASVTYTGKGGQVAQSTNTLPWSKTVARDQYLSFGSVTASVMGSSGALSCSITDETGKVIATNTSDGGQFATVSCNSNG